jgi:transposase-like protein
VIKVERHQSSWATAEALWSFSSGLTLGRAKGSTTKEEYLSISTPEQVDLKDYLTAEADDKVTGILYRRATTKPMPVALDEAGFAGDYADDGVNQAGSVNVKARKYGVANRTTFAQAIFCQQAQGADILAQQEQATNAARAATAKTLELQRELREQLQELTRERELAGLRVPGLEDHTKIVYQRDTVARAEALATLNLQWELRAQL